MTPFGEVIRKWGITIIITALAAMVMTVLIIPRLPKKQIVSVDITIPVPEREATTDYEYDGYYALQAADLFSGTIASWFKSPEFVARVYSNANVPLTASSVRAMEKIFSVKRVSGQLISVTFSVKDERQAGDMGAAIAGSLNERVEQVNKNGNRSVTFAAIVGKPLIVPNERNALFDSLIAGIVVLVFGFNAVIIIDAFKGEKKKAAE